MSIGTDRIEKMIKGFENQLMIEAINKIGGYDAAHTSSSEVLKIIEHPLFPRTFATRQAAFNCSKDAPEAPDQFMRFLEVDRQFSRQLPSGSFPARQAAYFFASSLKRG